jgi:cytoskeletal protein CcmA (bactofilin family)
MPQQPTSSASHSASSSASHGASSSASHSASSSASHSASSSASHSGTNGATRPGAAGDKRTLIEQGTEVKGTIKSTCPVVVNGRVEGELSAPELDVSITGTVRGNIKAERLSSRGTLSGNIDAGDLFLSGSVGSKTVIKAKNLEVKLAPDQGRMELTIGECTLDIGDEPTRERRAEPSVKAASLATASAPQLPLTKSISPVTPNPAREEQAEPRAPSVPPASATTKSDGDFAISKPPPKPGARDSVPPSAS